MTRLLILFAFVAVACAPQATTPASPSASAPATTSPSATATATASLPSQATPFPSPTAIDPTRYGYISVSPGRVVVRAERSTDPVLDVAGEQPVASHDGKRIAFWRTAPQGSNAQELRIVDVPSGTERVVTTIPAGQGGGAVAWANDDTGLLYETHSTALPATPRPPSGPDNSTLIAFDLSATQAPGSTESELMLSNGLVFIPLAWDKAAKIASALTTGEGGYTVSYYTWDMKVQPAGASPVTRNQFPWSVIYGNVQASPDAAFILAIDGAANVLRIWPLADIAKAEQVGPGGARIADARWRPGVRHDVAWVLDDVNVGVFSYQTSSVGTVYKGQSSVRILAWRVDGSGIVLNEQGNGVFIVDLARQQTTVTPLPHLGAVLIGGVLLR